MEQEASHAEGASVPTISTVVRRCFDAIEEAMAHAETFENGSSTATLEDERGRLRVWASNIGALQPASSPKSLDQRLRDAPLMKKSIHSGLQRVLIYAKRGWLT
jgi:hypothetical protein